MLKGTKAPTSRRLAGGLAAGILLAASIGVGGLHAQESNPDWLDWQKQGGNAPDGRGSTQGGVSAPGTVTTGAIGGSGADTQSRLLQLEDQVRRLTGQLDEMSHRLQQTDQRLQQLQQNMDLRLSKLEGGSGAGAQASASPMSTSPQNISPQSSSGVLGTMPAGSNASSAAAATASVSLPEGTPEVQYEYARGLLKQGRYGDARSAFEEFLKVHPNDTLSGNAQYWLGETYYAQGQYKNAADAFLNGYTTYKASQKAPDSLLKLGMTMIVLGQKDAACSVFGELGNKFPNASPAIVARAQRERQKAGC
ncbi:tol-pal system protein YbgF [Parvibaculum sp. MBR-TMA-1.3b-4.2]|jgi:tol-pal system protein YbgF